MATEIEQQVALSNFLAVWSDTYLLHDIAQKLTCTEADALAELLKAFVNPETAAEFIGAHAEGDDLYDGHFA